jgi:hypothetical protein
MISYNCGVPIDTSSDSIEIHSSASLELVNHTKGIQDNCGHEQRQKEQRKEKKRK